MTGRREKGRTGEGERDTAREKGGKGEGKRYTESGKREMECER